MMEKKVNRLDKKKSLIGLGCGIILLVIGILGSFVDVGETFSRAISIVFGLGGGVIGGSLGGLYKINKLEKDPERSKRMEIEFRDERNELIRDKASAKAGEIANWVILGLAYVGILVDLPTWLVFSLIGIFVVKYIVWIVLMNKYNKEF